MCVMAETVSGVSTVTPGEGVRDVEGGKAVCSSQRRACAVSLLVRTGQGHAHVLPVFFLQGE